MIFWFLRFQRKQAISSRSNMSVAMKHTSTSGMIMNQLLADMIMSAIVVSGKECIQQRNRSSVSFEDECRIEGCLSGEASLIILDTLEVLMQNAKKLDDMQATLLKALEVLLHLLSCNESVSVMGHIFATQRALLVKVTQ